MKNVRVLAGLLIAVMLLSAMPLLQVSAAIPSAPATYASEAELMSAYEMVMDTKLNFKEGFSDSNITTSGTGSATYTADGLVLDGAVTWHWSNGSEDWCALGESTKAIMFTVKKEAANTGNFTINLPYWYGNTAGYSEHFLLNGDNTFQKKYTKTGNEDAWLELDGNEGFASTERRYMVVRSAEGAKAMSSHIFIEEEGGVWVPFGPGLSYNSDDGTVDTENAVPGQYNQGGWFQSDSFGGKGVAFSSTSGKTTIKDITLYEAVPDCSVPADGNYEDILKRYNMEVAKKVDFTAENFASSALAQELEFVNAGSGSVSYSTTDGAILAGGSLVWNNGNDLWTAFGEDTRAISVTIKIPDISTTSLATFFAYDQNSSEHYNFGVSGSSTMQRVTVSGGQNVYTDISGNGGVSANAFKNGFRTYMMIRMGDGTVHLYRTAAPATDGVAMYRCKNGSTTIESALTGKFSASPNGTGVVLRATGGTVNIADVTLYTAVPTAQEPLELHDGVGGAKIGDSAETATQPAQLQASLYSGIADSAKLIFAGYNAQGNLKAVTIKSKSELTDNKYIFDATSNREIATVKVFLWDGFKELNVLAGSKEVKISTVSQ